MMMVYCRFNFYKVFHLLGIFIFSAIILASCSGNNNIRRLSSQSVSTSPKKLVVIGVQSNVSRPELDNELIGYGISSLLRQKLFDTGQYAPIEDNPEIIQEINRLINRQWSGGDSFYMPNDADRIAARFNADAVAYAKITDFTTSRRKGMMGPFSKALTTVYIDVDVYIKEKGKQLIMVRGEGEGATSSSAFLYEIRDDKIYFDKTALGKATKMAIEEAVSEL